MKKSVVAVIVVIVIAVGGFFLLHRSSTSHTSNTAASASSNRVNAATTSSAVILKKSNATLGNYLTDSNGKALYTYAADTTNVSNCKGTCLTEWPAYQAANSTTNLPTGIGMIKRSDNGQVQFTYNGMPLYYFAGDKNGQITGDGVANFHVAKPASASTTPQPTPDASTPPASNNSSSW